MRSMWTNGATVLRTMFFKPAAGIPLLIFLSFLLCFTGGVPAAAISTGDRTAPLSVDEFTEAVISANYDLLQKQKKADLSRIEIKKAKAMRLPSIDSTLSYTLIGNPQDPIYLDAAAFGSIMPDASGMDNIKIMDGGEPGYFDFKLELQQPLFTWGRLAGYQKIMNIQAEIDMLSADDYTKELTAKVEGLYYSFYIMEEMEAILDRQGGMTEDLVRLTEENYLKGFIEPGNFLAVSGSQLDIQEAKNDIANEKMKLLFMMQELIADPSFSADRLDLSGIELELDMFPIPSSLDAVAAGLSENRQLNQLSLASKIKEEEVSVAKNGGNFRPDLALKVAFSYNGARVPFIEEDWFRQDDFDLNITLAGSTSLWDSGLSKAEKEHKEAELESYKAREMQVRQKIQMQISQTVSSLEFSRRKLETLESRRNLSVDETKLVEEKYAQGEIAEAEYLKQKVQLSGYEMEIFKEWLSFVNSYSQLGYFIDE